jgi:YHS domain-containing protein
LEEGDESQWVEFDVFGSAQFELRIFVAEFGNSEVSNDVRMRKLLASVLASCNLLHTVILNQCDKDQIVRLSVLRFREYFDSRGADDFQSSVPCPLAARGVSQHEAGFRGPSNPAPLMRLDDLKSTPVGLDGFCPVCLIKGNKWELGTEQFQTVYDGITWRFPTNEAMEMFKRNPAAFVPALNGDCIVCFANADQRIHGDLRHGVFYRNRVLLFPSPKERDVFVANPARFADTDLALNGKPKFVPGGAPVGDHRLIYGILSG